MNKDQATEVVAALGRYVKIIIESSKRPTITNDILAIKAASERLVISLMEATADEKREVRSLEDQPSSTYRGDLSTNNRLDGAVDEPVRGTEAVEAASLTDGEA